MARRERIWTQERGGDYWGIGIGVSREAEFGAKCKSDRVISLELNSFRVHYPRIHWLKLRSPMPKYLSVFPKPLLDDLVAGRWLPMVGAGFSRNAIIPPSKKMPLWDGFRSQDEKRQIIVNGIRCGETDDVHAITTVRAAIALARKYQDNGAAAAKQIEHGFYDDAERIPADIIADYVARISTTDALFNVAREMEYASSAVTLPSLDDLTAEAKSLLGTFLDFNGISREKVALAWRSKSPRSAKPPKSSAQAPLFGDRN
jgi:hypothetical protein